MQAVPQAFREACWNMGATRWQTIRHVVLPNSISGILTGVILEISRTVGETAPIMFTGAAFFSSLSTTRCLRPNDGDVSPLVRGFDPSSGRTRASPIRIGNGVGSDWDCPRSQLNFHRFPNVPAG